MRRYSSSSSRGDKLSALCSKDPRLMSCSVVEEASHAGSVFGIGLRPSKTSVGEHCRAKPRTISAVTPRAPPVARTTSPLLKGNSPHSANGISARRGLQRAPGEIPTSSGPLHNISLTSEAVASSVLKLGDKSTALQEISGHSQDKALANPDKPPERASTGPPARPKLPSSCDTVTRNAGPYRAVRRSRGPTTCSNVKTRSR